MYVYIYVYIYTYTHTYTYTSIYLSIYLFIYLYLSIYLSIYLFMYLSLNSLNTLQDGKTCTAWRFSRWAAMGLPPDTALQPPHARVHVSVCV